MRKLFKAFLVVLLLAGAAFSAPVNLVQNSSFETWSAPANFANWTENGIYDVDSNARTGASAAYLENTTTIGSNSGLVSSWFNFTETGKYEYGAYFSFLSSVDPATLPDWPADRPGATVIANIGGWNYPSTIVNIDQNLGTSWTLADGLWRSDWYLITGTFDLTQLGQGQLNLFIQNYSSVFSAVIVDDAFVQRVEPVPEPSTVFLIGAGLTGLAFLRRRAKK